MTIRGRRLLVTLILLVLFKFALFLLLRRDWELRSQYVQLMNAPLNARTLQIDDQNEWQLDEDLPEVDFDFWYRYAKPNELQLNSSCARYPNPMRLQLHNEVWQTFLNRNITFRLYATYLDKRSAVHWSAGIVRILATANQMSYRFPPTYCQLWYDGHKQPIVVLISEYLSIWPQYWGFWPLLSYPHLLSCPLPMDLPLHLKDAIPRTVSLTTRYCDSANNSLRVNYGQPKGALPTPSTNVNSSSSPQLSFGVCLKAFDFPNEDVSKQLIEWFELQRLLGASRIYAHLYAVSPAVQQVLDYYQDAGFLELRPLTLANGVSLQNLNHREYFKQHQMVKRLNELIPYNDCFYRNMHRHDYLVNVDIDEVIMPRGKLRSWQQVVDEHEKASKSDCPNGISSICLINGYFTRDPQPPPASEEPEELYFLQRSWRSQNFSELKFATKCFHNTRYSATLHNHITILRLPSGCPAHFLSTELAYLQHYREQNKFNKSELIEDRTAWKFATELRAAVRLVRAELNRQSEEAEYISDEEQQQHYEEEEEE